MKLIAAIALFVLSLALAVVGVADRTIWAPEPTKTLSVEFDSGYPYVVIPEATLSAYAGDPTITVSGAKKAFIASGRESDIRAWLGQTSNTELSIETKAKKSKLEVKSNFGTSNFANPRQSDLWRSEVTAIKAASLEVDKSQNAGVLVASDGFTAAPGKISIVWPVVHDLTTSNTLLIVALVLLACAFALNAWHLADLRKRGGPRRRLPKAPQGPKTRRHKSQLVLPGKGRRVARKTATSLIGISVIASLAGCSTPSVDATPTPTASKDVIVADPPVVVEKQLERILANIADVAAAADEAKDKQLLEARFDGPALALRSTHYTLMKKSTKIEALPAISAKPLTWSLPASTSQWPRTIMAVTDTPGSALPQMVVMQQDNPRAKYIVYYFMNLVPGAEIPAVPVPEVGAIPVSPDSAYLRVPPRDIPVTYGDVIDKGSSSLSAGIYNVKKDKYYADVSALQKTQTEKLTNATIKFKHTLGTAKVLALATSNGGALVAVYMKDTYTIKPKKTGSGVTVSGSEKLLLGKNGSVKGVVSTYGNMMLFFVPALTDSDRAVLLGVSQGLLAVRGL